MVMFRCGHGFDAHRLVVGRPLILGGILIPYHLGLLGHSDADVLTHAIIDSILGALALGDIGGIFPDTDQSYKNINSLFLLEKVTHLPQVATYTLLNLDTTIIAEKPKLADYIPYMREKIATIFSCDINAISVKAKTTEGMGYCGREEGIAAHANILLLNHMESKK